MKYNSTKFKYEMTDSLQSYHLNIPLKCIFFLNVHYDFILESYDFSTTHSVTRLTLAQIQQGSDSSHARFSIRHLGHVGQMHYMATTFVGRN